MQRNNDIINYIHGQKEFTEDEIRDADVTQDGRVLVNDIVLIQKSKPTFVDDILSIDKTGIYIGRTRELRADTKLAGFTIILNKPVSNITFINGTNNLVTVTENETILTVVFDTPMEITTTTKMVHFNESEIPQFKYDDKRFMLSDQYGMVMNPQKEPTLSISVSTNIAVVTFRPYTVSTVDKTNHISNFQFDYDGINLTKLKKNPLSGYNVSIGKSRVIVYTMKGNIDLNTSENIVFEFEYTLASTPKIRSAMFVDAEINIASYVLLIPETLQLIYKQSVPYVNNNINALTEYKGLSNSTVGRTSYYYGDLTNDWVEPLNGVVDSDSSIETGNINVNDLTLGLRMFVDKDVYNGTKAINEATATSEVDKIFVTKIQQLLVFADQPNTAIYTVEAISGIQFLAPPKTFALTNLRHILNIIDIALNKKPVVKYNGVVDVYKSNDDIVIKTSGVISGVTLYFEENNALLVDTVGIVSTESDETYTVALSGLPGGFVLGTHRIIAVDTGKGGIYCETTPSDFVPVSPLIFKPGSGGWGHSSRGYKFRRQERVFIIYMLTWNNDELHDIQYDTNNNIWVDRGGSNPQYVIEQGDEVVVSNDDGVLGIFDNPYYTAPINHLQKVFHHGSFDNVYSDGSVTTAASNGHMYADTPVGTYGFFKIKTIISNDLQTTYIIQPLYSFNADVLVLAGGGGGGHTRSGGDGAGGLVYKEGHNFDSDEIQIIVGNGGVNGGGINGSTGTGIESGTSGNNSFVTNIDEAYGGGAGGDEVAGRVGGSSSGGGGRNTEPSADPFPPGQGHRGGKAGIDNFNGAGGGGAGGVGRDQSSGVGGVGLDYSSQFGNKYGENGWFGGGGGGARAPDIVSQGGNGGGGNGTFYSNYLQVDKMGMNHTGGGGGGCHYHLQPRNFGGRGGSGIVIIKSAPVNQVYFVRGQWVGSHDGYEYERTEADNLIYYRQNSFGSPDYSVFYNKETDRSMGTIRK